MKVILSTEDLNSYGFWVLTAGIMLGRFKKNPVVTLNHDKWSMSVGKINNIRVEDGQLVGDIEFDEEDEKGKELKRKYEKGYMNGFSIGIRVLTWSEETKHIKEGQTRATVVKSELMEIAAATVPSNSSAVRLYDADGEILSLSANTLGTILPEISKTENKMKDIALSLGLPENATEQEINAKIAELKAKQTEQSDTAQLAAMFISLGVAKGVIIVDGENANKAYFEKLYNLDANLAVKMVELFEKKAQEQAPEITETKENGKPKSKEETLSALLSQFGSKVTETAPKKWADLSEQELIELREKADYIEYIKLYTEHYGKAPKL